MMTTGIVSARSFFRHQTQNKVTSSATDWLVLSQSVIRTKCYITCLKSGYDSPLASEQDSKGQVAEMTTRWSPVTNRRYFRRHGSLEMSSQVRYSFFTVMRIMTARNLMISFTHSI